MMRFLGRSIIWRALFVLFYSIGVVSMTDSCSKSCLIINELTKHQPGAEVLRSDLENLTNDDFDINYSSLLSYKGFVIRNQSHLTVDGLRGLYAHHLTASHLPGYSDVNVVFNMKNEHGRPSGLFGIYFENIHSDESCYELL